MPSTLFDGLNFLIVVSKPSQLADAQTVESILRDNACSSCHIYKTYEAETPAIETISQMISYLPDVDFHFIVSETTNFSFYKLASFDLMIPVVQPAWVHVCLSSKRIMRNLPYSPDERHVLKNCQVYLSRSGITEMDYLSLHEMVISLGGTCTDYLSNKNTHLVTVDPNDPAIKAVISFKHAPTIQFVYPTWIVHCFKTLVHIAEAEHLIDLSAIESSSEKLKNLYSHLEDDVGFDSNMATFLQSHKFLIGMDMSLSRELYTFLIQFIDAQGGKVIRHLDESEFSHLNADVYIGRTTNSEEYQVATGLNMYTGNLYWLFYMWSMNSFVSPNYKLIFTPFKKRVFEKAQLWLSYSSYFGTQRLYIQKLTRLLGGIATPDLSRKNTHLVSRIDSGKKFQTAKAWSDSEIVLVNHLWLENCYIAGTKLDPKDSKYTTYPAPGGLTTSLGQARWEYAENSENILSSAHPDEMSKSLGNDDNLELNESDNETVVSMSHENIDIKDEEEQSDLKFPETKSTGTAKNGSLQSYSNLFDGLSQDDVNKNKSAEVSDTSSRLKTEMFEKVEVMAYMKEDASKTIEESNGKENLTQDGQISVPFTATASRANSLSDMSFSATSSSGGRAAKQKAAKRLHTDMESLNEFQRSSKRNRAIPLLPEEIAQLEQNKQLDIKARELLLKVVPEDVYSILSQSTAARSKLPYNMDAICTGCHDNINELDLHILKLLGIRIHREIENSAHMNTIIAPKRMRTAKFLKALSFRPLKYALTPDFITDLLKIVRKGKPTEISLDLAKYCIEGVSEDLLKKTHSHSKVFERAGIKKVNLLKDIPGGVDVISSILQCHGIQDINVVPSMFTVADLVANVAEKTSKRENAPEYILIANKASQVKRFKKNLPADSVSAIAVEWNWCVNCMFNLDVDLTDHIGIVFKKMDNK